MAEQKKEEKSSDLDSCIQYPTRRKPAPSSTPKRINDKLPVINTPNEALLAFNDSDFQMFNKIRIKYGSKLDVFYPDDTTRFVQGYSHEKEREIETYKRIDELLKRGKQYDFDSILSAPMDNNDEEESLKAWPVFIYGYDNEGHPVMYDEIGSSNPLKLDECFDGKMRKLKIFRFRVLRRLHNTKRIQNMRYQYDGSVNDKGGFNAITKHVIVMDIKNFHAKSLTARYRNLVRDIIGDESNLWPNTLEKMYIINAPWPFRFAWKIISNFIHPITVKKIDILGGDYIKKMKKKINLDQIPMEYGGNGKYRIKWGYTADIDNDIIDGNYCSQSDPINLETIPCIKNREKLKNNIYNNDDDKKCNDNDNDNNNDDIKDQKDKSDANGSGSDDSYVKVKGNDKGNDNDNDNDGDKNKNKNKNKNIDKEKVNK